MKSKKSEEKPIVQTLKVNQALFVRLKIFAAKTRRTNQDILHTALMDYLRKMRA